MKREIKFRAWDKHKKTFIDSDVYAVINRTAFGAFGVMIKDWEDYKEGEFFYDEAQELAQFTGLKDKNGKEIYEGDIVSHLMNDYTIPLSVVSFKDGMFVFIDDEDTTELIESLDYCEVIGNIYENPELLQS